MLLILSAESMSCECVKTEIAKARKREVREKKQVLFPVRLVPFEAIRDWECFDADGGRTRRGRYGSISFRTLVSGTSVTSIRRR